MPKIKININKTNQSKIDHWLKNINLDNKNEFIESFNKIIIEELRSLRDCSEKNVIHFFIESCNDVISKLEQPIWKNEYYDIVKTSYRAKLARKYTENQTFNNNIDIYFNEVKREYILHPMNESDSLEFLPENRDIFIKNNLKLVVNCAKRYRGLGLPFEDLIQVGNYGLLIAFDKFDTSRANLRKDIIKEIEESDLFSFSYQDAESIIRNKFTYGKLLDKTLKALPESGFANKQEFIDWVMINVKTAVFASVAFQWIKALILFELSHLSNTVHIPKSAMKDGIPSILSLDSFNPHTDDNYHDNQIATVANEEFLIESESLEREENESIYKNTVEKILGTLPGVDRRIVKKKFGIGLPSELSINEIAESEGLSPSKVKSIFAQAMKTLSEKITPGERETLIDLFS